MTTVTSLGTGSGIDLEGMVTKLMAVESQPLTALQTKVTSYQTRISSLGTLNTSLDALQTAAKALKTSTTQTASEKFATYTASSSTSTVATATTTTSGVSTGSHSLTVTNIATAQQIRQSAVSVPTVAGSLSIQVGTGSAVSVAIDAGSSLSAVASAINDSGAGVTASIITSGTTSYLTLTANDTGAANTITVTGSDSGSTTGTAWSSAFNYSSTTAGNWEEKVTPVDAELTVDGIAVTSASNTLTSISGLSVSLLAAGTTTLSVSRDSTTALTSALNAFITAYNASLTTMSGLNAYNPTTETAGALQGDSTLTTAQNQIRSLLFRTTAGGTSSYQYISDIGVSVADDGSLSLDTTKLGKAVTADFSGVANLVAKVGSAYDATLENISGTNGTLVAATTSANNMIKVTEEREATLTSRLSSIEAIYRAQFSALDTLISSLNTTSTYLTQQLAALSSSS